MKKKSEEKKQIIPIFQPALFWQYQQHQTTSLDKVDSFLVTYSNELKALITQQKTLEQNYQLLCEKIGINVHPSLSKKPKQNSQFPSLKNNDYGQKYAVFMNHKIDSITLRLFGFLISQFKLQSLKISNNNLEKQIDELRKILEKEDQLTSLYFEWNALLDSPKRQQMFVCCVRPSLQHLILRQCRMGNQIVRIILKKIRENTESRLKSLDLYGNDISHELTQQISIFVQENKSLQFLGLSKNCLNSDDFLTRFFSSIGQVPLTEQQYEQHKLKQKFRDQILEKNKKRKKGTPEQPVPFVCEVKDTPNGKYFIKNMSLRVLNLANNAIKDSSSSILRKFIEGPAKHLELFIEGNKFTKTTRETFKFYENVIC